MNGSRILLGLLLLNACARAHEGPSKPASEQLSALVVGDWRYSYITAGTSARYGRLVFLDGGELLVDTHVWGPDPDQKRGDCMMGTHSITPGGTVRYAWQGPAGHSEREHSAAFADAQLLAGAGTAERRYWVHRGLVAADATLTRFVGLTSEHDAAEDEVLRHRSVSLELTFSTPLTRLLGAAHCDLALQVTVEALTDDRIATRQASFDLPCSVRERDARAVEIVVAGWLAPDAAGRTLVPLAEAPAYSAQHAWVDFLEAEGFAERWVEQPLYHELSAAFSPDLIFDRERPETLVPRDFDTNSILPEGYLLSAPDSGPAWWSACTR